MDYNITEYQAKYMANFLTRRLPANDLNKLTASLQDAQVDLTPHQVESLKDYYLLIHDIVKRTTSFEYCLWEISDLR